MIPVPVPALAGLAVLVTRPASAGASLCRRIAALGGEAVPLPVIVIEPLLEPVLISSAPTPRVRAYDIVIFVSPNAVAYGLKIVPHSPATRFAAIGKSTATALTEAGSAPAIVPEAGFTSEALLAHAALRDPALAHVLIVRGGGGREVLGESLMARGIEVDYLEVYRRMPAMLEAAERTAIETRWSQGGVDVVTVTSGEILHTLHQLLTPGGRQLLASTPLLVVSPRLADTARALGCRGEILVAPSADDDALVGQLVRWLTRART